MDFLFNEVIQQSAFDILFIGGMAVLLQVYILKIAQRTVLNEGDDDGSLFNLVRVTRRSTDKESSERVEAESTSAAFSSVVLLILMVCGILFMSFLSRHVSGEQLGFVVVFIQGVELARFVLARFDVDNNVRRANAALFGLIIAYTWYISNNWIVDDLCAVMICLMVARMIIRPVPIKALFASSLAIIAYDFWGVWGTKTVGGGAIMESVEKLSETHMPPLAIVSPTFPLDAASETSCVLGLGDVALPAFVICTAARYGLHRAVLGSYVVGLLATNFILFKFHIPVPAMVPVLPIMLVTFLVAAKVKGVRLTEKKSVVPEPEVASAL